MADEQTLSPAERIANMPDFAILGEGDTGDVSNLPPVDPGQPEPEQPEEAEAEATEEAAPDDDQDTPPEAEAESDDDSPETDDPESSEDDDDLFPVVVDGEELEVTYEELTSGYQRQADYTRKTMELAEARKTFTAEREQARQQQAARLMEMDRWLDAPAPDPRLLDENYEGWNPDLYHKQKAAQEQTQLARQQVHSEFAQLKQQKQQEEAQLLLRKWPEAENVKARQAVAKGMVEHYGYTEQDLAALDDHRVMLIARDALETRKARDKAPEVIKKLKAKPKVNKPGQRRSKQNSNAARAAKARDRLRSSGHVRDAASAILELGDL